MLASLKNSGKSPPESVTELGSEIPDRLRGKASREGRGAEAIAAVLADALEWEAEERAEAIEVIRLGMASFEAKGFRFREEVIAEKSQVWPARLRRQSCRRRNGSSLLQQRRLMPLPRVRPVASAQ
jgi:hypothetical protein